MEVIKRLLIAIIYSDFLFRVYKIMLQKILTSNFLSSSLLILVVHDSSVIFGMALPRILTELSP